MLVFFSIPVLWEHISILNVRLGGETDQQNVIMHKAYYKRPKWNLKRLSNIKQKEQRLTVDESLAALETTNTGKSPGSDGFPSEF